MLTGAPASERVTLDTIDNLISELPTPDFIKVDVEGYQLEVLRGAEYCLKIHAPLLMAELRDVGETNRAIFGEIEDYVADLGYQLYEIRKHSIRQCDGLSDTAKRNFFLVSGAFPCLFQNFTVAEVN